MKHLLQNTLTVIFIGLLGNIFAQTDGSTDPSFSGDGMVRTPIHSEDRANSLALTFDNKIVLAGQTLTGSGFNTAVVKYNSDGSLDNSFGGDGITELNVVSGLDGAEAVAVQTDGKIVVASIIEQGAEFNFALMRFKTDGSPDSTFDADGKRLINLSPGDDLARDVALQSDGKIVIAGSSFNGSNYDVLIARFNTNGSFDNTFNGTGYKKIAVGSEHDYAFQLEIQPDGKIVTGGYTTDTEENILLIRVSTSGVLDDTFSGDGISLTSWTTDGVGALNLGAAYTIELQSDGKIVMGGILEQSPASAFGGWLAFARYDEDGSFDESFGDNGVAQILIATSGIDVSETVLDIAIQSDGKIIGATSSFYVSTNHFMAVRINSGGTLDASFGTDGYIQTDIGDDGLEDLSGAIAIDNSVGKFILGGYSYNGSDNDFAAARYFAEDVPVDPCSTAPTGLFADPVTSTKAALHWNAEAGATKYKIQYRALGTTTWIPVNSVINSKNLNALTPATTYQWRVLSRCPENSPWSMIQEFTTLPLRIGELSDIHIYPNPAHDIIYIQISEKENLPVIITDISGKIVSSGNISSEGTYQIHDLNPGLYFVSVCMENPVLYKLMVE